MSEHTQFVILRSDQKNKKIVTDEQVTEAYKYSGYNLTDDSDRFNRKVEEKDIPDYVANGRLSYINHNTKEEFVSVLEQEFNSMFSCLKEEFNLSAYTCNNTIEIPLIEAEEMLEAINYLLSEKYDKFLEEDVLENKYIKIFGSTFTPYFNYYIKLDNEKTVDEEGNSYLASYGQDYLDDRAILKRVKIILDTFILLHMDDHWNDLKHVLIYTIL